MSNYLSVITANINNSTLAKSSIGLKLSGKGFNDNSNINYDNNGIGFQLTSNANNYKEFAIINTSNYSNTSLQIAITEPAIYMKTRNIPFIINSNFTIINSNIGIGITNPQYALNIKGNITLFGNFYNNNFTKWNNNSNIYYNQGNIGIGTTVPQSLLHLSSVQSLIKITDSIITGKDSNQNGLLWNYNNTNLFFGTSNKEQFRITSNGKIGIGTVNPQSNIDIKGDLLLSGNINNSIFNSTNLWNYGTLNGITLFASINSNTSLTLTQNCIIKYNYGSDININAGTYNITFSNGAISITGLSSDYSYPILKDTNNITINPSMWYKFDNNILDSSGNNNDLILSGGTYYFYSTVFAKGITSISNNNDTNLLLYSTNNYTIDNITPNISVVFWYNIYGLGMMFDILCSGTTGYFFIQRYTTTNKIVIKFANVSLTSTNDYYIADNKWHHFAMTGEKVGTSVRLKLYIDSILVEDNGASGTGTWLSYTDKLNVFNDGLAAKLYMDDLRVYIGTVLTLSQIQELYNGNIKIYQNPNNEVLQVINYNTSFTLMQNAILRFNYNRDVSIGSGTYSINFADGLININNYLIYDNSYPILKDTNGTIINPDAWYQFDDYLNIGAETNGLYSMSIAGATFFVAAKGTFSGYFTGNVYLYGTGVNLDNKSFSISWWSYAEDINSRYIYSLNNQFSTSVRNTLYIGYRNTTTFTFAFWGDDLDITILSSDHINKWVFWTLTFNSINNQKSIYINGVLSGSGYGGGSLLSRNQDYQIGRKFSGSDNFFGRIDDFRIYTNRVLTQSQINEIYLGRVEIIQSKGTIIYYNKGNIGIGTTIPQSLLQLSSVQSLVKINDNLSFGKNSNQNGLIWNNDNFNLIFGTSNQEKIRINSNGNIGIGTNNPRTLLDINSNININGNLIISSVNKINSNIFYYSNQELNILNYNLSNYNLPITTCNINNITSTNYSYILITSNTTIQINNPIYSDLLLVGAGGDGGLGAYSGGGGAGEVIYYSNYLLNIGTYIFTPSIPLINNMTKITYNNNDIIKSFNGGNGIYYNITISGIYSSSNISATNFKYISFTGNSTITFTQSTNCDILIIGGGGGGGSRHAGGGGAGALIYLTNQSLIGTYNITIGSGGAGGSGFIADGNNGNDTIITKNSINIYLAKGGGAGGGYNAPNNQGFAGGSSGGSAGGRQVISATPVTNNIPSGTYGNYGGMGGIGVEPYWAGGGGGGAGGAGGNGIQVQSGTPFSGTGGIGRQIDITGVLTYYAGGGGGGLYNSYPPANGGLGGGGVGGNNDGAVNINQHGIANTGGGGGGGGYVGTSSGTGGNGGSGIVIIRYNLNSEYIFVSGGSGGGGYSNNSGTPAGTPNNENFSLITSGSAGTATKGGDGGSALSTGRFITTITGSSLSVGLGGTGATATSIAMNGVNYGDGGSGNGGLGAPGVIVMRFPTTASKYLTITNNYTEMSNLQISGNIYTSNFTIIDNYWTKSTINTSNIYYTQGNIGIGTLRPVFKLDIIDDINVVGNYYQNGSLLTYSGSGTVIFSDSRIKTNIIDINDNDALQQILKIEPKIYNYIDTTERGTDTVYGFIAQQIREVIPQAVKIQKDFIPNIYKYYDCINYNQIITDEDLTTILKIGDRIKIKDNNQDFYRTAIIITITETMITVDLTIYGDKCFIYGKEINDFHYLDKNYIYTLGVCATQDLYKILNGLNDKYNEQQMKIKRIKELLQQ